MRTSRLFARVTLAAALILAAAIPILAFILRGYDKAETWTVTAGALAVITSVISTWSSRRVLELQEDAQKPKPIPAFDMTSKYGSVLLRVTNSGATPAYNISLKWNIDLLGHDNEKLGFIQKGDRPGIGHLLAGESLSQMVDVHHSFIRRLPASDYSGEITFEDSLGQKYAKPFRLSGKQYENTPSYDDERQKTAFELQKIPKELQAIRDLLEKIAQNKTSPF
jgi:hypothetical protein